MKDNKPVVDNPRKTFMEEYMKRLLLNDHVQHVLNNKRNKLIDGVVIKI